MTKEQIIKKLNAEKRQYKKENIKGHPLLGFQLSVIDALIAKYKSGELQPPADNVMQVV